MNYKKLFSKIMNISFIVFTMGTIFWLAIGEPLTEFGKYIGILLASSNLMDSTLFRSKTFDALPKSIQEELTKLFKGHYLLVVHILLSVIGIIHAVACLCLLSLYIFQDYVMSFNFFMLMIYIPMFLVIINHRIMAYQMNRRILYDLQFHEKISGLLNKLEPTATVKTETPSETSEDISSFKDNLKQKINVNSKSEVPFIMDFLVVNAMLVLGQDLPFETKQEYLDVVNKNEDKLPVEICFYIKAMNEYGVLRISKAFLWYYEICAKVSLANVEDSSPLRRKLFYMTVVMSALGLYTAKVPLDKFSVDLMKSLAPLPKSDQFWNIVETNMDQIKQITLMIQDFYNENPQTEAL